MLLPMIVNDQQLADYCQQIQSESRLALDTEFIRTRTFFPQLGLLQIKAGAHLALIDPLAIKQWQPLLNLFNSITTGKYFHACSEDLEVFLHAFNLLPTPLIDSQILASFLDNPLSSGYASLLAKYLHVTIEKSETRTDWLARPLTNRQCQYAADDVEYLLPLIDVLEAQLKQAGWLSMAYQECELVSARKRHPLVADEAYKAINNAWRLNPEQLSRLQRLAAWRLNYATSHDIAINFVVHEEILWQCARLVPTSLPALENLGLKGRALRLFGLQLLAILAQPIEAPLPVIKRPIDYANYKEINQQIKHAASELINQTGLSEGLLASRRQINQYIRWVNGDEQERPELISGWRAALFAPYLA